MKRLYHPLILGLVFWLTAVGVAFYAQNQLTPGGNPIRNPLGTVPAASWWYGLAAVFAVLGVAMLDRKVPLFDPMSSPPKVVLAEIRWRSPMRILALVLIAASLLSAGLGVYLIDGRKAYDLAVWFWLASLALMATGIGLSARHAWQWRWPRWDRERGFEVILMLAILGLAIWLRWPDLAVVPPDVHGDEAAVGLEARRVLQGQVPNLFGVGWAVIPYISYAYSAIFMWIFGDDLYGLRMASVFAGGSSILLLYLVVKRLFTIRVALLAAFLLAVSQWQIHYSRDGICNIQAQFALLLVFYFVLRGLETRRALDFLIAGFATGFGLNVYFAARLAPVLIGIYLLHQVILDRGFLRRHLLGFLTLVLGVLLFQAPMLAYYTHDQASFTVRSDGVFLLSNPGHLKHAYAAYKVDRVEDVLRIQTVDSLLAFNLMGETGLQFGHRRPLLDFWSGALFVLGVAIVTLRPHRPRYLFVALWFWLTLFLGSVLTPDALFSPRLIGLVPVLFIFPALVIDAGWRGFGALLGGRRSFLVFVIPLVIFLFLSGRANREDYFGTFVNKEMPAGFFTSVSRYIGQINGDYRVYLIGNSDTTLFYDTPHFLLPNVDGVDVRNLPLNLPLRVVPAGKGVAFLIAAGTPEGPERLRAIKAAYPQGKEELHKVTTGAPAFYSYLVSHGALVTANPRARLDFLPAARLTPDELEKRR